MDPANSVVKRLKFGRLYKMVLLSNGFVIIIDPIKNNIINTEWVITNNKYLCISKVLCCIFCHGLFCTTGIIKSITVDPI